MRAAGNASSWRVGASPPCSPRIANASQRCASLATSLRPPTLTDNRDRSWKQRVWANAGPDWRTQRLNGVAIPPRCLVALWAVRLRDPISCEVFTLTPINGHKTQVSQPTAHKRLTTTQPHTIFTYTIISRCRLRLSPLWLCSSHRLCSSFPFYLRSHAQNDQSLRPWASPRHSGPLDTTSLRPGTAGMLGHSTHRGTLTHNT